MPENSSKHVLMVVAHNNFRDEEYTTTREKLEAAGVKITVASTVSKNAQGTQGLKIDPDLMIDDVDPEQYDAVVFVGGSGSSQYWHDVKAHEIALNLNKREKLVVAGSYATPILAVAGLLSGKNATGHVAVYEKLQVGGAKYTGKKVEKDGNIITSSGANAVKQLAELLAQSL